MIRLKGETILTATDTEGEFTGQGVVRVWVRGAGGTYPTGETVTLQEWAEFEGETGAWVDDPSTDAEWTAEEKKFLALVGTSKYRLLASAVGFVARVDTFADNSEIMV